MDLMKIITIEIVIIGFLILLYGFFSCNQSAEYRVIGMDFECYISYSMIASMVMLGGVAIAGVVIRKIEKNAKKKKPEKEIELAWPAEPKEKP